MSFHLVFWAQAKIIPLRFLGVDAFWSLCMAWNVYLAFFYKYTAQQLRSLDKWYLLGCYGASFVPALTFLFVDTSRRGKIYGPAIVSLVASAMFLESC